MQQSIFTVTSNRLIAAGTWEMRLAGDTSAVTRPGQFVNFRLEGLYLRRPISVCDCRDGELTIIYKTVGRGTEQMSRLAPGAQLDVLTGLGNGFDSEKSGDKPLLIGGGVGTAPMYWLARELRAQGKPVTVISGFANAGDMFYKEELEALGARVLITTNDGSAGIGGFVTAALGEAGEASHLYVCGPEPMLKAVHKATETTGDFSFEERMGCGFGACMGCTCETLTGYKRICKDGPVLERGEILW